MLKFSRKLHFLLLKEKEKLKLVVVSLLAVILLSSIIITGEICWAISIVTTGTWSETIDASDLAAGAGSNLISSYESASNAVSMDISATIGNWGVDVKKIDTNWHGDFHLYVQRTSDGTGSGTISGGGTYQEVSDSDLNFFSGSDDRSNVDIQLKLTGVSIQVSPDVYTTTIYYTVFDL